MENDPDLNSNLQFKPELISRRGELVAWFCAALVWAGWLIFIISDNKVPVTVSFMGIFLLFTALAISLGNWMDRRTKINIFSDHISFENGVRHANMVWEDIQRIEVLPSNWGKKVRVIGRRSHFDFRTLGEVNVRGEIKARLGFIDGDKILDMIVQKAGLIPAEVSNTGYYYTRR